MTANQFLICYLVYHKDGKNIIKYTNEVGQFERDDILYLIDHDFILTTVKGIYEIDNFVVTPKFSELILIEGNTAAKELFDVYPKWISIDGKEYSARSCGLTRVEIIYPKAIYNDIVLHRTIIDIVKVYKKYNNYAEMGIDKFIDSRHWELLESKYKSKRDIEPGYGESEVQ